jgi:hypothetical protein
MNESNLIQLKVIVERAVRPVCASTSLKRKMREELLAHVSGAFEEEAAKLGDDRVALERTALRFGNAAEVTSQLQDSVPASDRFSKLWEARPDESTLRGTLRFAGIETAIIFVAILFVSAWDSGWSTRELMNLVSSPVFMTIWAVAPLWLMGIAFFSHWMEKMLQGHGTVSGWPRIGLINFLASAWSVWMVRTALIVGGISVLTLFCFGIANWPTRAFDWDRSTLTLAAIPFAGLIGAFTVSCSWFLVQTMAQRRRYHQEWASLALEVQAPIGATQQ